MDAFLNGNRHGDVNILGCFCGAIVPLQCEAILWGSGPIYCDFLPF